MKQSRSRYFALHVAGLRNGSFIVVRPNGNIFQYINGDYMGDLAKLPTTYADLPLSEYQAKDAEKLIPVCCGGKH